jgi:hypothetical protein
MTKLKRSSCDLFHLGSDEAESLPLAGRARRRPSGRRSLQERRCFASAMAEAMPTGPAHRAGQRPDPVGRPDDKLHIVRKRRPGWSRRAKLALRCHKHGFRCSYPHPTGPNEEFGPATLPARGRDKPASAARLICDRPPPPGDAKGSSPSPISSYAMALLPGGPAARLVRWLSPDVRQLQSPPEGGAVAGALLLARREACAPAEPRQEGAPIC